MTRREALLGLAGAGVSTAQSSRPNIVLILADDLGYGETGFQGNSQIPTPHIDSIAASGVRFSDGYSTAPVCCPARAGLITGRYQTRFGHERNLIGRQNSGPNAGLPLSEATMPQLLKQAGYATGMVGKWHLGATAPFRPRRRGFDEFYGFLHEGHYFLPPPYKGATTRLRPNEPPYDEENPLLRGDQELVEPEYLTKAIAREATAFIEKHRAQPFFLYLPFNAIHSPMQAPVDYVKRFNHIGDEHRQLFAAMLSSFDDAVGSVLGALRSHSLERNTLVAFLSDNGGPIAELTSANGVLRGGKGNVWEGGIRVPFAMKWPGRIQPGRSVSTPVTALDLLPTFLNAAGASRPEKPLDGTDLLPIANGQSSGDRPLFWRYGPNIALRHGRWKLARQVERGRPQRPLELFDLAEDPGESRDLAAARPEIARRLQSEMDRLNSEMVPPLW